MYIWSWFLYLSDRLILYHYGTPSLSLVTFFCFKICFFRHRHSNSSSLLFILCMAYLFWSFTFNLFVYSGQFFFYDFDIFKLYFLNDHIIQFTFFFWCTFLWILIHVVMCNHSHNRIENNFVTPPQNSLVVFLYSHTLPANPVPSIQWYSSYFFPLSFFSSEALYWVM